MHGKSTKNKPKFEWLLINNYSNSQPQVANATHDLTCRMPQTAGEMDNSDDTNSESDSNSSSDDIVVVDSSNAPSEFSFIRSLNLSTDSDVEILLWGSDTSTIPETDSDTNGSRKLLCQIHDNNIQHKNYNQLLRISQH